MSTVAERFFAKVDVGNSPAGCWMWTASRFPTGYGQFTLHGKTTTAHRAAHKLLVGPIPDGLHIDHLCRERACVNPLHLEAVTQRENLVRGVVTVEPAWRASAAKRAEITHCPQGHEYDEENTIVYNGSRRCRVCVRRHGRDHMRRKRATEAVA